MTHDEYRRKCKWLREVLQDAEDRGDYYLEMDVKEKLAEIRDQYDEENEE